MAFEKLNCNCNCANLQRNETNRAKKDLRSNYTYRQCDTQWSTLASAFKYTHSFEKKQLNRPAERVKFLKNERIKRTLWFCQWFEIPIDTIRPKTRLVRMPVFYFFFICFQCSTMLLTTFYQCRCFCFFLFIFFIYLCYAMKWMFLWWTQIEFESMPFLWSLYWITDLRTILNRIQCFIEIKIH